MKEEWKGKEGKEKEGRDGKEKLREWNLKGKKKGKKNEGKKR